MLGSLLASRIQSLTIHASQVLARFSPSIQTLTSSFLSVGIRTATGPSSSGPCKAHKLPVALFLSKSSLLLQIGRRRGGQDTQNLHCHSHSGSILGGGGG